MLLLAGAVSLQSEGDRWENVSRDLRIEAHDDSIAIRDDAVMIRDSAKAAPIQFKVAWGSIRYNLVELRAAAKAETKTAANHFSGRSQNGN